MFDTFKDMLNTPVTIEPYTGIDSAGDKTYGNSINTHGYIEDRVHIVMDGKGKEVVSMSTLYMDGDIAITADDSIIYNNRPYPIKALSAFYNSNGKCELRLVHL